MNKNLLYLGYCPSHSRHDPQTHVITGKQFNVNGRPHPEAPRRANIILECVRNVEGVYAQVDHQRKATDDELRLVHTQDLIDFLKYAWVKWMEDPKSLLADDLNYNFPPEINEESKFAELVPEAFAPACEGIPVFRPKWVGGLCGLYCNDTCTPIGPNTEEEARKSAALAIDVTKKVVHEGWKLAYALCRPPGHHVPKSKYGGYCYFNNAALAAKLMVLSNKYNGPVAVLDIDYHHGNGTQEIFYDTNEVLYISIHADPSFEYPNCFEQQPVWIFAHCTRYPFFSGGETETGAGKGVGFNLNFPLPPLTDYTTYEPILKQAIQTIRDLRCAALVVSFGLDTADGDPLGSFKIRKPDYQSIGEHIFCDLFNC